MHPLIMASSQAWAMVSEYSRTSNTEDMQDLAAKFECASIVDLMDLH